jgi:REP element-mobilizing transposase RayT
MARVVRTSLPDGYFHVIARGAGGISIARDDLDWEALAAQIRRTARRFGWTLHAVCLMTTHYHIVVEATREALSRGMCELNGKHARRFNRRHDRFGHLFSERFGARVIADDDYLTNACEYVLANPVRAGLCAAPGDWPWSWSCV